MQKNLLHLQAYVLKITFNKIHRPIPYFARKIAIITYLIAHFDFVTLAIRAENDNNQRHIITK